MLLLSKFLCPCFWSQTLELTTYFQTKVSEVSLGVEWEGSVQKPYRIFRWFFLWFSEGHCTDYPSCSSSGMVSS